ncbi:MAG: DNA polymerase III subunit [Dehalococcoidia bacterium]|jgi:DNA polymerase-3 subunit delta'|nr:DNA polymerase III subunit [Dehalococcoidia bacterium]
MWRTFGQEGAIERLSRSVAEGTPHHAYLFLGPEHVGKKTLAIDLACALNCEDAKPPCGTCRACTRILEEKHADIHTVAMDNSAASAEADADDDSRKRRTRVATEQIADLQHAASLPPYEGRWKVLLIEHADHMSAEAANRLLKTLEEPPPHVVWMLLAESEERMLETVVSRCQRVDVRPLPVLDLERHLVEAHQVPDDRARLIARISRGRTGWALTAITDGSLLTERASQVESAIQLPAMTYTARFDRSREMEAQFKRDRSTVLETLEQWTMWWRDLLLVKSGSADSMVNADYDSDIREQAQRLTLEQIRDYIGRLSQAKQDLEANVLPRLVFDSLLYTMPRIARLAGEAAPLTVVPSGENGA